MSSLVVPGFCACLKHQGGANELRARHEQPQTAHTKALHQLQTKANLGAAMLLKAKEEDVAVLWSRRSQSLGQKLPPERRQDKMPFVVTNALSLHRQLVSNS